MSAPQAGALGFFPWVCIEGDVEIAEFVLRAWAQEAAEPSWVAALLEPYEDGTGNTIRTATIVDVDGDLSGHWNDDTMARFFEVRELISFCALTRRRFFAHCGYCNDQTFRAFVQKFDTARGGGAARTSRRRDGEQTVFVTREVHRVAAPDHVSANNTADLDHDLLAALEAGWARPPTWAWLGEAITFFNLANTDGDELREHTELVLIVASIQATLGLGGKFEEVALREAFAKRLDLAEAPTKDISDCPRSNATGSPPSGIGLRALWFRDLYHTRNAISHGQTTTTRPMRWTTQEHLLLAAHIVPMLVLTRLAEDGVYTLSDDDKDAIAAFDRLLCMSNCFAFDETYPGYRTFRWPSVVSRLARWRP